MFKKANLTIPNFLSLCRVLFIPLLLYYVHNNMRLEFLIGYILVASTDFFDGQIARRFNQKSDIGKVLDSYCDLILYLTTAYFIYVLYPEQIVPVLPMLYALIGIIILSLIVSAIKIGHPVMLHTWLLKAPSGLLFIHIIFSYFYSTPIALGTVIAVYMLGFVESIIIFIKYGDVNPDVVSMFHVEANDEPTAASKAA